MIAESTNLAQIFEGTMLVCFGLSWAVAIIKSLRTRRTEGKSLGFLTLVLIGYFAGISAKLIRAVVAGEPPEPVTILYAINALLVAADIACYLKFRPAKEVS